MAKFLEKKKYFNGKFGKVTIDGEIIYEIQSANAEIELVKEQIGQAGMLGSDAVVVDVNGTGTYVINKVVTRGKKKYLDAVKSGDTPTFDMIIEQGGSNAYGKETTMISNCVPDSIPLFDFDIDTPRVQETVSFTFNPTRADIDSVVDPKVLG